MSIKKASGRCSNTNPTDTARYTRSHMLRGLYHSIFAPALLATGRGPSFYLHPGRSPESQAKERQQRQDNEASHGGQLLYPCGSMRRVSAWSDRVTDICVQRAGCDGNKKAVRRRQALNAKIPPMPGGKGGMKFRCLGHMWARAEAGRRSLPLHHDAWCRFSVTCLNYYVIIVQ